MVALKLQKTLTKIAEEAIFKRLKASAPSPVDVARLISQAGPLASAWKNAVPIDKSLHLKASDYRLAVLYSLGLPLHKDMPSLCACGHSVREDPEHMLSCFIFAGELVNHRHDQLNHVVHNNVRRVGGSATIEPRHLLLASGKHPDLKALFGAICRLLDVTIATPKPDPLEAAEAAEHRKSRHYRELAAQCHAQFTPFAIETYGAWGDKARQFAAAVREFNDEELTGLTKREVYYRFCTEIAIVVQRGNAQVMEAWMQAARDREQIVFSAADRASVAF